MFQTKVVEKPKILNFMFNNSPTPEYRALYEIMWKIVYSWAGDRWKYGACALHVGYLRLQTHTHNMWYLLLSHCNNGYAKAPQCYVERALSPLLFWRILSYSTHFATCAVCFFLWQWEMVACTWYALCSVIFEKFSRMAERVHSLQVHL